MNLKTCDFEERLDGVSPHPVSRPTPEVRCFGGIEETGLFPEGNLRIVPTDVAACAQIIDQTPQVGSVRVALGPNPCWMAGFRG